MDVQDVYSSSEDIKCKFIAENYKIKSGDRIAIFEMGWRSLKNYILFEWVVDSFDNPEEIKSVTFNSKISILEIFVIYFVFLEFDLPSTINGFYLFQFCYISCENVVHGVSTPFQINPSDAFKSFVITDSFYNDSTSYMKQQLCAKDKEIIKLKEENAILKECLKNFMEQKKPNCGTEALVDELSSLKEVISELKSCQITQHKEIESLKQEVQSNKNIDKKIVLDKIISETSDFSFKKFNGIEDIQEIRSIPPFPLDFD